VEYIEAPPWTALLLASKVVLTASTEQVDACGMGTNTSTVFSHIEQMSVCHHSEKKSSTTMTGIWVLGRGGRGVGRHLQIANQ
jgi:hypothetical protein